MTLQCPFHSCRGILAHAIVVFLSSRSWLWWVCRDKLKHAKGWMKDQRIPHEEALVAMQYLQQSFKSKAVYGSDGEHDRVLS